MKCISIGLVALFAMLSAAVIFNLGIMFNAVMVRSLSVPLPLASRRMEGERRDYEVPEEEEEEKEEEYGGGTAQEKMFECPSVLAAARQGSWHQSLSLAQKQEMMRFYSMLIIRGDVTPFNSQRYDGKCGNVSFPYPHTNWRASCNPNGPTPCCYDNVCVSKSVAECACADCLDMRTMVFAEHATWRPSDERCPMTTMTKLEVCQLLAGHTVVLVGDSLMLHFYLGLLSMVRGDEGPYGAIARMKDRCGDKDVFLTRNGCLSRVPFTARVCEGTAWTKYIRFYHPSEGLSPRAMINLLVAQLKGRKTIAVLGVGSHYGVDSSQAAQDTVLPLLQQMSLEGVAYSHKLVFAGVHAKKNYRAGGQEASFTEQAVRYNADMEEMLRPWDVPVMDTFNLTYHRVLSLDGNHYGLGVNRAKANILLHYFSELQRKGLW